MEVIVEEREDEESRAVVEVTFSFIQFATSQRTGGSSIPFNVSIQNCRQNAGCGCFILALDEVKRRNANASEEGMMRGHSFISIKFKSKRKSCGNDY